MQLRMIALVVGILACQMLGGCRPQAKAEVKLDAPPQALLARIDTDQSFWLAVLGSTLAKSPLASQGDEAKEIIDKLQDATAGVTIEKDIKVQLSATAKTADDAKELGTSLKKHLNQAVGTVMLLASGNDELSTLVDLLKTLKPTVKGKVVGLELQVSGEMIQKAIERTVPTSTISRS